MRFGRDGRGWDGRSAFMGGRSHRDWHRRSFINSWHHRGWHRGFWGFNTWGRGHMWGGAWFPGPFWGSMWGHYPMWGHFGMTMWGINRAAWGFGYWDYYNPYFIAAPQIVVYDYAQPLVVYEQPYYVVGEAAAAQAPAELPPGVTPEAVQAFEVGMSAFRGGDYESALERVNFVIQETPQDAVAHEFRSLVLFSLGRYDEAAEAIYAVLAVSPGWDWETLSGLYPNVEAYTQQLRALEGYVGQNPQSSAGRFLLAYHYMSCGHEDAAVTQLKRVLEVSPENKVAADLLTMFEGPEALAEIEGAAPSIVPPAAQVDVPDVDSGQVTGRWKAEAGDASFSLNLDPEGRFVWVFTRNGRQEEITGAWEIDGNVLALEAETGDVMLAELGSVEDDGFTFRMVGAPPEDAGLSFRRQARE